MVNQNFDIALYHEKPMLEALQAALAQQACVILCVYPFSIFPLEHTVPMTLDYMCSLY